MATLLAVLPVTLPAALLLASLGLLLAPVYYALGWGLAGALTRPRASPPPGDLEGISAVICFVDEHEELTSTTEAFLASEGSFPREVWLVGDAPTPEARASAVGLAQRYPQVQLLVLERARGKAAAQALGVRRAHHPSLLFLDARTRVEPQAAAFLVAPLEDPGVAYTTGRLEYDGEGRAEGGYWRLEQWIRRAEDAGLGPLGASGGLLACRRRDYVPCPPEAMLDLVIPCVLERLTGGRGRYVEAAIGREPARPNASAWRRARVRIQARALASTGLLRGWLAGAGIWRAGQYVAHKLLRWYAAFSVVVLCGSVLLGATVLWDRSGPGLALHQACRLSAGLLLASWLLSLARPWRRLPLVAAPGYAFGVQLAGWALAIRGRSPRNWSPGPNRPNGSEQEE